MDRPGQRSRLIVDGATKPVLPRFIKLRRDEARKQWIILAPERVLTADEIAVDILRRCDGETSVDAIAIALAEEYEAPLDEIMSDVLELLQEMADKGYVEG